MNRTIKIVFLIFLLCMAGADLSVQARINLVSLPDRGATVIRLDYPQATLVEEERILTLQKGLNRVDFSWKGVGIDPDSIRLAMLSHPDKVVLLNVSYPPGEAALVWEISSAGAWEEKVRVSYLLANMDRLIKHIVMTDRQEKRLRLKSRLILRNFSGEDFDRSTIVPGDGGLFEQATRHEETKEMLLYTVENVPFQKIWRFDARSQPWDPEKVAQNVGIPVSYQIANISANGLGRFALLQGKVRVFQEDGHGSTIFLGEDRVSTVPVGEKAQIRIGDSRDVLVTQRKLKDGKINVRRNKKNKIVLYDTEEVIHAKMENFKDQPAVLTMVQHIPGQWDMADCNMPYTLKDAHTLEFEVTLPPRSQKELTMHYNRRNVR
jgi:hypothetical protein